MCSFGLGNWGVSRHEGTKVSVFVRFPLGASFLFSQWSSQQVVQEHNCVGSVPSSFYFFVSIAQPGTAATKSSTSATSLDTPGLPLSSSFSTSMQSSQTGAGGGISCGDGAGASPPTGGGVLGKGGGISDGGVSVPLPAGGAGGALGAAHPKEKKSMAAAAKMAANVASFMKAP